MPPTGLGVSCQAPRKTPQRPQHGAQIAGDAVEIAMLATHLSYDTSNLQTATVPVATLHQRVALAAASRQRCRRSHPHLARERWASPPPARSARPHQRMDPVRPRSRNCRTPPQVRADIDALEPPDRCHRRLENRRAGRPACAAARATDLVHDIMALRRQIREEQSRPPKLAFAQGETILYGAAS